MSKLVLIDGNAIMHRAYHALPPLTTTDGEPINAVYGLVSMLIRLVTELKPTHLAVCFDRPEPTFRKKISKDYQGKRPKMEDDLSGQFIQAKKVLEAMNIKIFEKAGFEADDILGTIATISGADETVIVTGDRDILQLVDDKIKVFMPVKGLSEGKLMNSEDVAERMGVRPELIPEFKAFAGDASDNYFGVPGIGPKNAIKLLDKYESVENIYKHIDEIDEKLRKKLVEGKDSATLSLKLATIIKDVPVDFILEETSKWVVDSPKLLEVFEEFGFKTLTRRIKEMGERIEKEKQGSLF